MCVPGGGAVVRWYSPFQGPPPLRAAYFHCPFPSLLPFPLLSELSFRGGAGSVTQELEQQMEDMLCSGDGRRARQRLIAKQQSVRSKVGTGSMNAAGLVERAGDVVLTPNHSRVDKVQSFLL